MEVTNISCKEIRKRKVVFVFVLKSRVFGFVFDSCPEEVKGGLCLKQVMDLSGSGDIWTIIGLVNLVNLRVCGDGYTDGPRGVTMFTKCAKIEMVVKVFAHS